MNIQPLAFLVLCSLYSAHAGITLFSDSFESPSVSGGSLSYTTGETFNGWTVTSGTVTIRNDTFASEGSQVLQFQTGTYITRQIPGSFSVQPADYLASFRMDPLAPSTVGSVAMTIRAVIFGMSGMSFNPHSDRWDTTGFGQVVANPYSMQGGVDTLTFSFNGNAGALALLDNVTITSTVPEPSTYAACFGVGLLGFGFIRRFRGRT